MHLSIKPIWLIINLLLMSFTLYPSSHAQSTDAPIKLVVVGATHGHFPWVLEREGKKDIELVGIYEPNRELANQYSEKYGLSEDLWFEDLEKMLGAVEPDAAVAFGSIYEHMAAVEACAPRGIHVMVEKPLATNMKHAQKMAELARKHNVHLLTNYETSWYPTTEKTYQLVKDQFVGELRKVIVRTGHEGPEEIGVGKEFLDWLTDPVQNGGGALIDFGCYGANIMTYLMEGQAPVAVTAVTHQYKPETYPKVDDDATIIIDYANVQCIVQASWNWPFGRKDMEVYGDAGYLITESPNAMLIKNKALENEENLQLSAEDLDVYTDPFSYFADVIQGKVKVDKHGLYSLENNLMVVRILEAARKSAATGKTIMLQDGL